MIDAVKIVKNDKNEYNLAFLKDNEWNFLYDHLNIRESVKKEIENINLKNSKIVIIIGVGLGYHLVDLINEKLLNKKISIIAIEPIEMVFKVSNKLFNLEKTFENAVNITYIHGTETDISNGIASVAKVLQAKLRDVLFFIPKSYIKYFYKDVKKIIKILNDRLLSSVLSIGNSVDDSILGIYNMFRNTQSITESLPLGVLKSYYKNYPAVIVSAGPSLNKNIDVLKENQDKVIVIATDATFSILKEYGIRVDFVGVLERDYITYEKFFENKNYDHLPTLIYQSVAWPDIAATFKNTKIITFKTLPTETKFAEFLGENYCYLDSGTSVATMLISFSHFVGANPIILIGQDLAYSNEGYTHANGVNVRKKQNLEDAIEVDGINGEKVKTSQVWKNFKIEIEDLIKNNNLNVIDATEGGALIKGTKIATLKETLEILPNIKISYKFKNISIDKNVVLENIKKYKSFLIEEIINSTNELEKLTKIDPKNWDDFLFQYSKIEKFTYFPHFHSSNSNLLVYYHHNKKNDKIPILLDAMIEESILLKDYINTGFNIGINYKNILSNLSFELTGNMEKDLEKANFLMRNRMPFKAIKFLNKMKEKYTNNFKIYELLIEAYSDFDIEKAFKADKTIAYGLELISSNPSYKTNPKILSSIDKAINFVFERTKIGYLYNKINKDKLYISMNNILKVLIVINNVAKQCEVIKYFENDPGTFEYCVAKYNCLVYKNLKDEAKNHLINALKKYPDNQILLNELKKYSNS